ncbi:MAG: helix-turn-helix domain-containing protein [Planctomycetota bacterium]|jgi:AraC-like DNA-binding protein
MTAGQLAGIRVRPVDARKLIVAPGCSKDNYIFPHYSLVYLLRGKADFRIDEGMITTGRGEIAFLPPHALRTSGNGYSEPCEPVSVDFDVPVKAEARRLVDYYFEKSVYSDGGKGRERLAMVLRTGYREEIARLFIAIQRELESDQPDRHAMAAAFLMQLIILVGRAAAEEKNISESKSPAPSVGDAWRAQEVWMAAVSYMADHLEKPLTVKTLAQHVRLSNQRFTQLFKLFSGVSPMQYFTKMRIDSARELLLTSTASIKEITTMVGFSDPLYFSRVFRRQMGVSPRAFRKGDVALSASETG